MTLEITTGLKGSRSPDISSRETNHQCDLARPITAPSTADITFRMVDLDNRTHRIASHRIASRRCTRGSEMRNAGRKLRFSRNFACFRFPDAEKKSTLKFFLFHSLTPLLHPSRPRTAKSSLPFTVRRILVSFVIFSFSFPRFSQPIIIVFLFLFNSPFTFQSYLLSFNSYHSHKYIYTYIHVYTHMHTPSPLRLSSRLQVYVLIFTIIICGNV